MKKLTFAIVFLLQVNFAFATIIKDFNLHDLIRPSHVCALFKITGVQDLGNHVTRYNATVEDLIFGDLPLDWSIDVKNNVIGSPRLKVGEEYLLFINFNNTIERIISLYQGVYLLKDEKLVNYVGNTIKFEDFKLIGIKSNQSKSLAVSYASLRDIIINERNKMLENGESIVSGEMQ